jgi:cellulose synthase/poly-beta-1,6-N-acetylglucosamine synthase-like glycosyltransferase
VPPENKPSELPAVAKPLVSVIVPACNAEDTLERTLRSAPASTYRNIEIIVVDDGSTYRTAAVAGQFAKGDRSVRVHRQANRGLLGALNAGFSLATGDYMARLDAGPVATFQARTANRAGPEAARSRAAFHLIRYAEPMTA